jgi:hypothetical protein
MATTHFYSKPMISIFPSSTFLTYVVITFIGCVYIAAYSLCKNLLDIRSVFRSRQFTDKQVDLRGFNCLVYRQLSANFMVVTTVLFTHTTFLWATCCLICFQSFSCSWHTDLDYGSYRICNLEIVLLFFAALWWNKHILYSCASKAMVGSPYK